jgi:hypothetical protein
VCDCHGMVADGALLRWLCHSKTSLLQPVSDVWMRLPGMHAERPLLLATCTTTCTMPNPQALAGPSTGLLTHQALPTDTHRQDQEGEPVADRGPCCRALVPELMDELRKAGMQHVMVVCGGIIPEQDYPALKAAGVAAIYGPGTRIPDAATEMLSIMMDGSSGSDSDDGKA